MYIDNISYWEGSQGLQITAFSLHHSFALKEKEVIKS